MAIQTASSITAFTPGTKLFAPQVRLVKQDGAPLTIGEVAINEDVISISITQVCNNVGQAEITLNNQRFDGFRPVTPIWRYNKLDPKETSFGTRLRIDLRYGNDPWTPMMLVRVTELSFTFPSTTAGVLVLKGEDLLSMLKTRRAEPKKHEKLHEIDIVESTVNDSGCGLSIAPFSPRNMFATPLATLTHEDGKTNLQFIQEIAERMDHEVYVEFEKPGEPLSADKDGKSAAVELVPKM